MMSELWFTWPADAGVLIDPLQTRGTVLTGVRSTFRDVLLTVVSYEARPLTVTHVAEERNTVKTVITLLFFWIDKVEKYKVYVACYMT